MESHQAFRDAVRSEFLENSGVQVLRFTNLEVLQTTDGVMEAILDALGRRESVLQAKIQMHARGRPSP